MKRGTNGDNLVLVRLIDNSSIQGFNKSGINRLLNIRTNTN